MYVTGEEYSEVMGDDVIGAAAPVRAPLLGMRRLPSWAQGQVAPGVYSAREGLEILPLTPEGDTNTFSATVTTINWSARPQRKYRPERLLVAARHSNASDGCLVLGQGPFVGTTPQMVELGEYDLEFFSRDAFGVRLTCTPAEPGILIRIQSRSSKTLTAPDTISCSLMFLGRTIA